MRQTELMDAALELFSSAGYQKTMIVDITKKTGAAKGTFYHYFASKEAIVEAICNRWAIETASAFQLESRQLASLPKLNLFIERLFLPKAPDVLFKRLWDEEQLNLYYKSWKSMVNTIFNPLLSDIIEQGNQEATMQVACQEQAIAFFWSTLTCVWEAIFFQDPPEVITAKAKMAASLLEHILGIKENTLKIALSNFKIR